MLARLGRLYPSGDQRCTSGNKIIHMERDRRRGQVKTCGVVLHQGEWNQLKRELLIREADLHYCERSGLLPALLDHANLLGPEPQTVSGVVHIQHDIPELHGHFHPSQLPAA